MSQICRSASSIRSSSSPEDLWRAGRQDQFAAVRVDVGGEERDPAPSVAVSTAFTRPWSASAAATATAALDQCVRSFEMDECDRDGTVLGSPSTCQNVGTYSR